MQWPGVLHRLTKTEVLILMCIASRPQDNYRQLARRANISLNKVYRCVNGDSGKLVREGLIKSKPKGKSMPILITDQGLAALSGFALVNEGGKTIIGVYGDSYE